MNRHYGIQVKQIEGNWKWVRKGNGDLLVHFSKSAAVVDANDLRLLCLENMYRHMAFEDFCIQELGFHDPVEDAA